MITVIDDFLDPDDFSNIHEFCCNYIYHDERVEYPIEFFYVENGISCAPFEYESFVKYCKAIDGVTRHLLPNYHGIELWVNNNTSVGWHYDKDEHVFDNTGLYKLADLSTVFYTEVDLEEGGSFEYDGGTIEPKLNRLLIFGKGVMHRVNPFVGKRWSVAANLWEERINIR